MKKILIIQKYIKIPFVNYNTYDEIYGYQSIIDQFKIHKSVSVNILQDDFYTARMNIRGDHQAVVELDKVYNKMIKENNLKILKTIGNELYAKSVFEKFILKELASVFQAFIFAEKVMKEYKIDGKVDFIPDSFSYKIFKTAIKCKLLSDKITIPNRIILQFKIYGFLKHFYFFIKLISFPEYSFLKMNNRSKKETKKKYKIGVHVHNGIRFKGDGAAYPLDFFIDNNEIKKKDVLYVIDEPAPAEYVREVKESGYEYINFFYDLLKKYSRIKFLKKHYFFLNNLRFSLGWLNLKLFFMTNVLFHIFKDYLIWKIFFDLYSVEKFFCIMHPGPITKDLSLYKNGSKSIFLHTSITHPRLSRGKDNMKAEYNYYSRLKYDFFIGTETTNKWFESNQNYVAEYINLGSITSDFVYKFRRTKSEEVKSNLGIKKDDFLISFFDHTVGNMGILTINDEILILNSIKKILESDNRYYVIFKFKKNDVRKYYSKYKELINVFDEINKIPNFIYQQDVNLTTFEVMGTSDLVVSAPISSVIYEAVIGGVKTISYDPSNRYNQDHIITEHFPNFSAHSHEELEALIKYWLHDCDENKFSEFQNKYIKPNFDKYCDGQAISRFRKFLIQ